MWESRLRISVSNLASMALHEEELSGVEQVLDIGHLGLIQVLGACWVLNEYVALALDPAVHDRSVDSS